MPRASSSVSGREVRKAVEALEAAYIEFSANADRY